MDMSALIDAAAASAADVAAKVRPDQMAAPTPCAQWDVRALANHMSGFLVMSECAARKAPLPAADGEQDMTADPGWTRWYGEQARKLAAAWADPAALRGTTAFGPGEYPAELAAAITLMELTVHGWDLARATGQALPVGEDVARTVHQVVTEIADNARANGSFAAAVAIAESTAESTAESASTFDRTLAATGRDPGWSPAAS
jgi:uncharacterized protein (TIGR03086 family)